MKTAEELKLSLWRSDLSGRNLSSVDFSGLEIERVDFSNSDLTNANFSNSKIKGCVFNNATLEGANFSKATVEDFKGRKLYDYFCTTATNAKFNNCNFTGTYVRAVDFSGSQFNGADFTGATISSGMTDNYVTKFNNCDLTGAILNKALIDASFVEVKMIDTKCQNVNFNSSGFKSVDFSGSIINGASFQYSFLGEGTKFNKASVNKVTWNNSINEAKRNDYGIYNTTGTESIDELIQKISDFYKEVAAKKNRS